MELNVNTAQRMRTLASRADGDKIWFVHIDDWQGDLNNQEIRICDKEKNVLFVLQKSSLEQASYICSMNNIFNKTLRETKDDSTV
jgi:hypothetical protein